MSRFLSTLLEKWLPHLNPQIWILSFGRFLSQTGTGFTIFFTSIFFVNQVGLSTTLVGISLASAQISGIFGRFLSGFLCDFSPWGRRKTLLLSTVISGIACLILAGSYNFPTMLLGNLCLGLGIGLYWPATETVVADLSPPQSRQDAFALTRLADSLGLQMGIILGGILIVFTNNYRLLFILDALSFFIFFWVIIYYIQESYHPPQTNSNPLEKNQPNENRWLNVLKDYTFLTYIFVNIIFTLYIAIFQTLLPLYFTNFLKMGNLTGFSPGIITTLFALNTLLSVLLQLPVLRYLRTLRHIHSLMIAGGLWGVSFITITLTGKTTEFPLIFAIFAMIFIAIALIFYTPSASALVADLAPESSRGIYLAMNSQCWGIGYLIGPLMGGWIFDQGKNAADLFWLGLSLSIIGVLLILKYLDHPVKKRVYH